MRKGLQYEPKEAEISLPGGGSGNDEKNQGRLCHCGAAAARLVSQLHHGAARTLSFRSPVIASNRRSKSGLRRSSPDSVYFSKSLSTLSSRLPCANWYGQ